MTPQPQTVLIVDDVAMIRRAVARLLNYLGWSTIEATSPEHAALLYRYADVVLSDWQMPHGGGARVLAESPVPVIIHTGSIDDIDAPVVLRKPCEPEVIDRALKQALDARRELARHLVTDLDRSAGRAAAAKYVAGVR